MNCILKIALVIALVTEIISGRSILQGDVGNIGSTITPEPRETDGLVAANSSNPINWPPKRPFTLRLAVALFNTSSAEGATTAREIEAGYQFWEYELKKRGGIPIGESKNALVEVKFLYSDKTGDLLTDSKRHQQLLTDAIINGEVDFVLGGETTFASDELSVSEQQRRITMLCCHGPPKVYRQAAEAALDSNGENMLFGIHVNSELYTKTLIRSIIVNKYASKIGLIVSNRDNIFTSTAADSAWRQLQILNNSGIYSDFPNVTTLEIPQKYGEDLEFHKSIARTIRDERFDTIFAFTLDADGRVFLRALQSEKPFLKTVFVTVTPTTKDSVENLTSSTPGVRMEHMLSAGQWHVQLNFGEDLQRVKSDRMERVLWPTSTMFAEQFENYTSAYKNSTQPTTYTEASAAAAAYVLQLGITEAFKECTQALDAGWVDGSASSLLFNTNWTCGSKNVYSQGGTQQNGNTMVLRAL